MRAKEFISENQSGIDLKVSKDSDGVAIQAQARGKVLGNAELFFDEQGRLDPQTLWVDDRYQSQGIAKAMYDHLKSLGYTVIRSWDQTDAGRGFWDKHRGPEVNVWESVDADQVLQYVKHAHAPDEFNIDSAVTDHPAWELKNIPVSQLKLDPEGEHQDPYGRVNWVDWDKVQDLLPKINAVLKRMPIVVDSQGWIIDGNHRATAAAEAGLKTVPAYVPAKQNVALKNIPSQISEGQQSEYEIHNIPKLDRVLEKCCHMVIKGQQQDPEKYGQVAACLIDPNNRMIYGINLPGPNGTRRHAERVVIEKYQRDIGDIPPGSIIVTTCSPCNSHMEERDGESCKDLLNSAGIHKVYAGYQDPTQHDDADADFNVYITKNDDLWEKCQLFAQTFLNSEELVSENFADGKHPEDKGDSKRYNVPTKGSISSLRKIAKQGGRRGQLAHWMANMKSGRAKAKHGK